MRTARPIVVALLVALILPTSALAAPWRIAVGGGRITGFVGVLSKYGFPREVVSDADLANLEVLREFDLVIVTTPVQNNDAVVRAITQFVAEGGCAITETTVAPGPDVVAGKRFGPKRSPNLSFVGHDHSISRAMAGVPVVATTGWQATAIDPTDKQAVTVLAHFTDQDVPDRYRGELTNGRRDLPAVLLFTHGEGAWLFSGAPIAVALSLRGPELEPAVLETLRVMSDGELTPRFEVMDAERRLLPRVRWEAQPREVTFRRAPRGVEPEPLPGAGTDEGASAQAGAFEVLDLPEDAPEDFVLVGELVPGADAELLLPWYSTRWHRSLTLRGGRARLTEVIDGREEVLRTAGLPALDGPTEVTVRRRPESLTLFVGRTAVLIAPLAPMAGTFAVRGLTDAFLQPAAPVYFDDDFMRAEGQANPWETPDGAWKLYQVEGEPAQGANPFAFRAEESERATALAGYDFWDDYEFTAAVRPLAATAGILAHRQADDDYVELRLAFLTGGEPQAAAGSATLELVRRLPSGERVLARAEVDAARDQWHELRLGISRGRAVATLDGRELLVAADELLRGRGRIGLRVTGGSAWFDDVRVRPWEATPLPLAGDGAWRVDRGTVEPSGSGLTLRPAGSGRALAPTGEYADLRASARVRLDGADEAGMLLRYRSPGDHYLLGPARVGRGVAVRFTRVQGGEATVLASAPVEGGADRWHELTATMRGRRLSVEIDGAPAFEVADEAFDAGAFGLACAGGPASFAEVFARPVENERHVVDPPTPPYAGIIDVHTWAGPGSGWAPTPDDLDRFWHRGLYVNDVEVRLGVHRVPSGAASASLMIGDGADPELGYAAQAVQAAPGEPVRVTITRGGAEAAAGSAPVRSGEGYALSFQRVGSLLVAAINGEPVCEYRDPAPLTGLTRVGFRRDEAALDPADAEVLSEAVRTYTFANAPTDWRAVSGTWEISNRWSCSPQWTWLAGWNQEGAARIHTRWAVVGEQRVDLYVGAKMMPKPDGSRGTYEELRDLHFGLCEDGAGGGYRVVLGGKGNTWSALLRNGQEVATNTTYRVPQAEQHNNWLLVTLVKSGATVSVRVWDQEVLSFTDPEPLEGGFVAMGTEHNGITVPRVTIYGRPASQRGLFALSGQHAVGNAP